MPLLTPNLDNRSFQDIVDDAKRRIPYYCPEWTDHNVSDPGVALIELFAWMTEMLLYRTNQVPEKNYIKFLDLIGVKLKPPEAAQTLVTFYLSAAQPAEMLIPQDTEVATIRTETHPAIVFTTEEDVTIRPALLKGAFTRPSHSSDSWITHGLEKLGLANHFLTLFPDPPIAGAAFYLLFENDLSNHMLALGFECDNAGGAGVDPNNPPLVWEVWQGNLAPWKSCEVEIDGTKGFNIDGEVLLQLPAMAAGEFQGNTGYWLRCRLTEDQSHPPRYEVSPRLRGPLHAESRGATVRAHHGMTIRNEVLGKSDGKPGSTWRLLNAPVLPRNESTDTLILTLPTGEQQSWHEVEDFADSGPNDRHFTLDNVDGLITLGPSLLQPDGSLYSFGAVPVKGSLLTFRRYQHGGGIVGNVPLGAISVMKSSLPFVSRVANRRPARFGKNAQTLEDAKTRAPLNLRTRKRAVTRADFEYLACQVPGVARSCCLAPGQQPAEAAMPKPGKVAVVVLPTATVPQVAPIPSEQLVLSAELRSKVLGYLTERCLVGCEVDVIAPHYSWLAVSATLRVAVSTTSVFAKGVQRSAEQQLYRFLNPLTGGPDGEGWPFGRELHYSEIQALLHNISGVEFVDELIIHLGEPGGETSTRIAPTKWAIPKNGLLCSLQHQVVVS